MTEGGLVVCLRLAEGDSSVPSVVGSCGFCSEKVWVSHTLLAFLQKTPDLKVVCTACLLTNLPDAVELGEIPGQRAEITAAGEDYDELVRRGAEFISRLIAGRKQQD